MPHSSPFAGNLCIAQVQDVGLVGDLDDSFPINDAVPESQKALAITDADQLSLLFRIIFFWPAARTCSTSQTCRLKSMN